MQVHAHYFEDGNVQLQTSKEIPEIVIPFTGAVELATQVVAHIEVRNFSICFLLRQDSNIANTLVLRYLLLMLCSLPKPICRRAWRRCTAT